MYSGTTDERNSARTRVHSNSVFNTPDQQEHSGLRRTVSYRVGWSSRTPQSRSSSERSARCPRRISAAAGCPSGSRSRTRSSRVHDVDDSGSWLCLAGTSLEGRRTTRIVCISIHSHKRYFGERGGHPPQTRVVLASHQKPPTRLRKIMSRIRAMTIHWHVRPIVRKQLGRQVLYSPRGRRHCTRIYSV